MHFSTTAFLLRRTNKNRMKEKTLNEQLNHQNIIELYKVRTDILSGVRYESHNEDCIHEMIRILIESSKIVNFCNRCTFQILIWICLSFPHHLCVKSFKQKRICSCCTLSPFIQFSIFSFRKPPSTCLYL